ncbi:hypothetical protein N6H18_03545 [Reichenbachiella agarivorans]|uniref:Uncharacterized protein n=1 Tax=Reichenbachiella agarivorans TaxID=2979464 RepID=A0ABY6CXU0_9BACT|nr:hypothetical protein [Reichenbachiella agarivorans]UXP33030.1 hypothetical protein N6H18_03545 [Reichenbachiella agarivorans]
MKPTSYILHSYPIGYVAPSYGSRLYLLAKSLQVAGTDRTHTTGCHNLQEQIVRVRRVAASCKNTSYQYKTSLQAATTDRSSTQGCCKLQGQIVAIPKPAATIARK